MMHKGLLGAGTGRVPAVTEIATSAHLRVPKMPLEDYNALEYLQQVYRDEMQPISVRIRCAVAALPFETPKLAVNYQVTDQDVAVILDKRIERLKAIREGRVIEHQPLEPVEPRAPTLTASRFRRRI